MRGVTSFLDTMSTTFGFLLTRLMRGVTLTPLSEPAFGKISTHTPHARRDRKIYEHFTITPQHIGGLNDKFLSN